MGETVGVLLLQAHGLQQVDHHLIPLLAALGQAVVVYALGHDIHHLHPGIQGGVGILEHHLRPAGELLVNGGGLLAVHHMAVKDHMAVGGGIEANDGAAQGGLAAARLTHQAQGLTLVDVEGHVIHGL